MAHIGTCDICGKQTINSKRCRRCYIIIADVAMVGGKIDIEAFRAMSEKQAQEEAAEDHRQCLRDMAEDAGRNSWRRLSADLAAEQAKVKKLEQELKQVRACVCLRFDCHNREPDAPIEK